MYNQEKRLEEIFKNNNNKGMAIAITGSWGVGKTFFWNSFIESRVREEKYVTDSYHYRLASLSDHKTIFNKKYAYVSLFGVESLSDLKTQIYTQLSGHHFSAKDQPKFEVPRWMKAIASGLKDEKFSHWGFSASMRFFDAMLFTQIKDAIICFDDFERMSNKLDIKDVMGLANQLKLEKNCQVALILDETKTEGDNKNKYAEYKEKLIDEVIKITSVEPLLRDRAKEANIDGELIELMVKFANELDIHNFRFFQKVIKLYKKFRDSFDGEVAFSTKETILIRILQGYFIEDYGSGSEYSWHDVKYFPEEERQDWSEKKLTYYGKLEKISDLFISYDQWMLEFKKWFEQKQKVNFENLRELANSNLISENNEKLRKDVDQLMQKWRNLEVDSGYCNELYEKAKASIRCNSMGKLYFYSFLLKKFGRNDLAKILKRDVISYIDLEIDSMILSIEEEMNFFGYEKDNLFYWYIHRYRKKYPLIGLPTLFSVLKKYIIYGLTTRDANRVLAHATLKDWEKFIFIESSSDEELNQMTKRDIIRIILDQTMDGGLRIHIRTIIEEILINKAKNSQVHELEKNIQYVVENFKKEGLL